MPSVTFSELFGSYISEESNMKIGQAAVTNCSLDSDERILTADVYSTQYIGRDELFGIESMIRSHLKLNRCTFTLTFAEEARPTQPAAESQKAETKKPEEPKRQITFEERDDLPENGIAYLDNPKAFYGRGRVDNNVKPMIDVIGGEDTDICCFGEVFDSEVRSIKTKRGDANIVSFCLVIIPTRCMRACFLTPNGWGK